jgi:ribosomal protein S18 acetylase RimI-like enzyme
VPSPQPRHEIRRATGTDAELDALAPLFDAYRVFYERPSDLARARTFLAARLQNGDSVVLIAEATDARAPLALGFTQLYPSFSSVACEAIWVLNDLYVAAIVRGEGVGRALMNAARDHAERTGVKRIVLATGTSNGPARALYESLGYRPSEGFLEYTLDVRTRT